MFPQLNQTTAAFNHAIINRDEPFHLDYDEHLQPYIDETINKIDREIIESHLENCSSCSHQVRDLREFKQSLELKKLKTALAEKAVESVWTKFAGWLNANFRVFAFASLLIGLSLFGLFAFFSSRNQVEEVKNLPNTNVAVPIQTPTAMPINEAVTPTPKIESNISSNINNQNTVVNLNKNTNANRIESTNKSVNVNQSSPIEMVETPSELVGLSGSNKEIVSKIMQTEKLSIPSFLTVLTVRGSNGNGKDEVSPNAVILRDTQPNFSWQNKKDAKFYELSIFDDNFKTLKTVTKLSSTNWKAASTLPRGKVLRWELKADNQSGTEQPQRGMFYILDDKAIREIAQVEANKQVSPLARGIVYAKNGLLAEAEKEFKNYLVKKPNSKIAQKLLNQVLQK